MHTLSAHQAFELFGRVDQLANLRIVLVYLVQVRHLFEGLVDRHANRCRNQFGNLVHVAIGQIHGTTAILDGSLGGHGVEGDDLAHLIAAILAHHILVDFDAPVHAEVDVDIRHRHALGIEEALEDQSVLHRIDIRNLHAVGHKRTRARATSWPDRNAVILGILDEVPHDQEVARVVHLQNDADFVVEPGLILGERVQLLAVELERAHRRLLAHLKTLAANMLKVAVDGVPLGHGKLRPRTLDRMQLEVAAFGNLHGV